jgi:hypothetical protein
MGNCGDQAGQIRAVGNRNADGLALLVNNSRYRRGKAAELEDGDLFAETGEFEGAVLRQVVAGRKEAEGDNC